jgi:hypothetical protein
VPYHVKKKEQAARGTRALCAGTKLTHTYVLVSFFLVISVPLSLFRSLPPSLSYIFEIVCNQGLIRIHRVYFGPVHVPDKRRAPICYKQGGQQENSALVRLRQTQSKENIHQGESGPLCIPHDGEYVSAYAPKSLRASGFQGHLGDIRHD